MALLDFDFLNQVITVPISLSTIDMQTLIDEIRDEEEELSPAMAYYKIADASGKDSLGGGIYTAITVRLLPNWQLKFADRPGPDTVQVSVTGGNLVGGIADNPIAASSFVQVIQQSSSSGTISIPEEDSTATTNLKYLLGSMMGGSGIIGSVIYWDPYGGDDSYEGVTPAQATKTFARAQTVAVDNNYDVIIALPTNPTGITTVTEAINITKKTLRLKGPGYNFQIKPNFSANTLRINADLVEVSGLYLETYNDTSIDAIQVNADNCAVRDCWIANARRHGISLSSADRATITSCAIENCGTSGSGNGINISSNSVHVFVNKNIVSECRNGIVLEGFNITDAVLENNLIYQNSNYGVDIGSGVVDTVLRGGYTIANNTVGEWLDNGTNTIIDAGAGYTPEQIADAVWDEIISDHTSLGSTGKTLRDAKTKATLASLK